MSCDSSETVWKLFGDFVEILLTLFRFTKTLSLPSLLSLLILLSLIHETLQGLLFIVNLISEYNSDLSLLTLERL